MWLNAKNSTVDINGVGVKPDYEVEQDGDWTVLSDTFDAQRARAREVVVGMLRSQEVATTASGEGETEEEAPGTEESAAAAQ